MFEAIAVAAEHPWPTFGAGLLRDDPSPESALACQVPSQSGAQRSRLAARSGCPI